MTDATVTTIAPARAAAPVPATLGYWGGVARRLRRDPLTLICLGVILAIVLAAIFAPFVSPADPYKTSMMARLKPVGTPGHLLGTDELGRDMLARLIYGGRISLFTGVTPVVLATLLGGVLGLAAGFFGGLVNTVIMRTMDVFYAFPSVLLAVAISGALGAGLLNVLIALTVVFIPPICRIAESVTTQARSEDYVEAARATGAATWRIIAVHVLPNVMGPVFIYASSLNSVSIVIASGLSFLGLGVSPPQADWGLMLNTLRQSIYIAPGQAVIPGVMIFITSMCFNLMSDGLRGAMDVKE
ncbi:ABC transporter permease [Acuticoccus sediminis]|uniref:ABC transporter permease n=1 Tax=Acuticoccus sediminis TaxID=2184697 RepID=A0A8B2NQ29_9HYPH|nr:ABC transporter permease [Acuticoccus sediminis]RAI01995.1 ABC transporter permease [Acuticoccus sediminis]